MRELLSKYISLNGENSIFDTGKLQEYLLSCNADAKEVFQIILILRCGNIKEYVERNDKSFSSVEINNIIIGCEKQTGLNMETVKKCLYNILMSLGIDCRYEKIFIPSTDNGSYEFTETSFIPTDEIENELEKAEVFINGENEIEKAIEIYIRLAKAGSPTAMYNLGMCYFDGIGTEKSEEKGLKWIEAASKNGDPRAKIKLGDYYYFNNNIFKRNFNKAYDLYSSPGVLTVNPSIKHNIVNILNQKKTNFIVLVFGGILTVLIWVFLFLYPSLTHNAHNLIGLGIPLTVISSLIYGGACYLYRVYKYNNLKIIIDLMMLIWSIYPLVLTISR